MNVEITGLTRRFGRTMAVAGADLPAGEAARREWLTGQWARVDAWISREWQFAAKSDGNHR